MTNEESSNNSNSNQQQQQVIRKPQAQWKDIDNSNTPFVPKIKEKPNATVATLAEVLKKSKLQQQGNNSSSTFIDSSTNSSGNSSIRYGSGLGVGGPVTRDSYPHPYEPELMELVMPTKQLFSTTTSNSSTPSSVIRTGVKSLKEVPCTWVDTRDQLLELSSILDMCTEFAIDLEQHSYRSFQGFVCLMQISTRTSDYLVDTIELRHMLHILNSSFTNPKILKVMHGSDCDIIWLQRDFGLYIVNLFDTGQASRALSLPSFSLAYLLKQYCNVDTNKKYQLADWRVRPLPSEMVKYARQDTHYLLYIYDCMRNDIMNYKRVSGNNSNSGNNSAGQEMMRDVYYQSRDLCLRRYEKELFSELSYLQLLNRVQQGNGNNNSGNNNNSSNTTVLTNEQCNVYRALYKWRDIVARREDESVRFVMPDHMLYIISEKVPRDMQSLLNYCNPVPKLVRVHAQFILKLVQKAHDEAQIIVTHPTTTVANNNSEQVLLNSNNTSIVTPPLYKHQPPLAQQGNNNNSGVAQNLMDHPAMKQQQQAQSQQQQVLNSGTSSNLVLSTEELYQTAGWLEVSGLEASHLIMSNNNNDNTSNNNMVSPQRPSNNNQRGGNNNNNIKNSRVKIAASATPSRMFGSSDINSNNTSSNSNYNVVSQIEQSFANQSILSPMRNVSYTSSNQQQQQQVQGEIDNDDPMVMETPVKQPKNSDDEEDDEMATPSDEKVPRSLHEIYKLSKKNRKRNKQKKKLKEDSVSDPSPAFNQQQQQQQQQDEEEEEEDTSTFDDEIDPQYTSTGPLEQPNEFMKKLGWSK